VLYKTLKTMMMCFECIGNLNLGAIMKIENSIKLTCREWTGTEAKEG